MQKLLKTTNHTIVASYRREERKGAAHERVEWRCVDLCNDLSTEKCIKGADVLVYLVHSLESRRFEEMDRIFADRVGAAARKMGVKKIIYLGGIIPNAEELSAHLRSRQETGRRLAEHGVATAELRASILLGACSASYQMVYQLSKRLPIVIMPTWSRTKCSPIAMEDAVDMIGALLDRKVAGHEIFDIGSEVMGYDELLLRSGAIARQKMNTIIHLPLFPMVIAAYAVQALTGVCRRTASALMGSLKNDSAVIDNRFTEIVGREPRPVDEVLCELHKQMSRSKNA
jgi:uncharacterized protein YbjT (DUF2867 family)